MTWEELVQLGYKIVSGKGTQKEIENWMTQFNESVPHPNGAGLFFYPEKYNARIDDISKYNPTVEEIVDKALSYKPIQL